MRVSESFARILRAADRRIVDDDLRALLADDDPGVRGTAAWALGQTPTLDGPGSREGRERLAPGGRASAAHAMGLHRRPVDGRGRPEWLADPQPRVRAAAAEALGRICTTRPGRPRFDPLLDDTDMPVRAASALAAWKFAEGGAVPRSRSSRTSPPWTPACVPRRGYALARLTSAATAPRVVGSPRRTPVRERASSRARAALVQRVEDGEPEVRMQIARGLAFPAAGRSSPSWARWRKTPTPASASTPCGRSATPRSSIKPHLERALTDRRSGVVARRRSRRSGRSADLRPWPRWGRLARQFRFGVAPRGRAERVGHRRSLASVQRRERDVEQP